ncbi:MAG: DNA repair protein RecN, partial [Gammaproteobacteria bacterium]|nr:DNA repair protein RecN [Gammaproteobacteria bacterium]
MLSRIEIKNFAIIKSLALDWSQGMTVITGETGAGKSIVIDALGLALGERADLSVIYSNENQAEVTASFDLTVDSAALNWLKENDLNDEHDCILRRTINESRSKCFINGVSVTLSQLKSLGDLLVDIHGQHEHQTLLKSKEQLNLLDRYACHDDLVKDVKSAASQISKIAHRKRELEAQKANREAMFDLLTYQVDELEKANPQTEILQNLEAEHKKAATTQTRLEIVQQCLESFDTDNHLSIRSQLSKVLAMTERLQAMDNNLNNLFEILAQADALLDEAHNELEQYNQQLNIEPQELQDLDDQLALFHDLSRKHHVTLEQLPDHFAQLKNQLAQLNDDETELNNIELAYQSAVKDYQGKAQILSESRQQTARQLEKLITDKIQTLAMEGGNVSFALQKNLDGFSSNGLETVEILVSANPGQPMQPLNKVASGGELSRISLAIAVITAEQQLVPALIFDEVDVGIGGATAETVGRLLNQLAKQRQVICVTHQPQVASCGDQHLLAS